MHTKWGCGFRATGPKLVPPSPVLGLMTILDTKWPASQGPQPSPVSRPFQRSVESSHGAPVRASAHGLSAESTGAFSPTLRTTLYPHLPVEKESLETMPPAKRAVFKSLTSTRCQRGEDSRFIISVGLAVHSGLKHLNNRDCFKVQAVAHLSIITPTLLI